MRDRVLATAIAAGVVGAALAALAADQVPGPEEGAGPSRERASSPAQATTASQGVGQEGTIGAASWQAPKQGRVPAGVLVRAASRRAQERDLPLCRAPERRHGRELEDVILSVEIDWNAGGAAER